MTQQLLSAGRSSVFQLISIDYGFYFYVVSLVFLLPLPWLLSSLTAAVLHELGHLAAAKCMKLEIHGIRLEVGGARIICAPPNNTQSLITAIAGPIVGFLLFVSVLSQNCILRISSIHVQSHTDHPLRWRKDSVIRMQ